MPIVAGCASPTQGVCRGLVSRGIRFVLIQWVFQLGYPSFRPLLPGGDSPLRLASGPCTYPMPTCENQLDALTSPL